VHAGKPGQKDFSILRGDTGELSPVSNPFGAQDGKVWIAHTARILRSQSHGDLVAVCTQGAGPGIKVGIFHLQSATFLTVVNVPEGIVSDQITLTETADGRVFLDVLDDPHDNAVDGGGQLNLIPVFGPEETSR
jgi:hypothetical protein